MKNMDKIKLHIPFMPISINKAYAGYPKRHKSNDYKEFEYKMEKYFLELWIKYEIEWNNWLSIKYDFYFPIYNKNWTIKKKDLENYLKVLNDTISYHIPWFLDEKIKHISMSKWESEKEYIEIEIKELV